MGSRTAYRSARAATAALLLCAAAAAPPARSADAVEIITSPDHSAVPLDRATLRAIFLMRIRQWPDGMPVHVFVMPGNTEVHDRFTRELLGTYPYVLDRTWDRLVFTGTGLAPEVVRSQDEMREKVRNTPGAIGYQLAEPRSETEPRLLAKPATGDREHGTR